MPTKYVTVNGTAVHYFHAGPTTLPVKEPTAFWRIEIWEFNKRYGGWTKDDPKTMVVVREQVPIRVLRTYRWMFDKRLGGIPVAADGTVEETYTSCLDPALVACP